MEICKLCLEKEATQTGSHIVSAFYIKPVIGSRDKEKGYLITKNPFQDYKENTKAEPIKEDKILCPDCEKRFSYIETIIAEELSNKFRKDNFKINFPESKEKRRITLVECKRVNPFAYQAFVYSLVWRASISNARLTKAFQITDKLQEALRALLNLIIPPSEGYRGVVYDKKKWFTELAAQAEIFSYPFIVVSPENLSTETTDGFVLVYHSLSKPYNIMIGDSLIYFGASSKNHDDWFGLLERVNKKGFYNADTNPTRITLVPDDLWQKTRKKLINEVVQGRKNEFLNSFALWYSDKHGTLPIGWKKLGLIAYAKHVTESMIKDDELQDENREV
jgi:hypothetical protein